MQDATMYLLKKKKKLMDKGTYTYRGLQHALENI